MCACLRRVVYIWASNVLSSLGLRNQLRSNTHIKGSADSTVSLAESCDVKVLRAPQAGRASCLNHGALHASGSLLFFLHSDTVVTPVYGKVIRKAMMDPRILVRTRKRAR